jgi:beta-phosphoglucomutase
MSFAFLFDMDGVLIHSMPTHIEAWRVWLQRHKVSADNLESRMHGRRNDALVRDLFGEHLSAEEVTYHGSGKEALYREMMAPQVEEYLVPGIRQFLDAFPEVPKGIGSNAERANIDFVLDAAGLRPYFSEVLSGEEMEFPKPHPHIWWDLSARLAAPREHCVIFEDSQTGLDSAHAAGIAAVAVNTSNERLAKYAKQVMDFRMPAAELAVRELMLQLDGGAANSPTLSALHSGR